MKKTEVLFYSQSSVEKERVSIYSLLSVTIVLFKFFLVARENKACFDLLKQVAKTTLISIYLL